MTRLRTLAPGTIVSIAVHIVLTIFGIMLWRSMIRDLTAPEPIAVELVTSVPGDKTGDGKGGGGKKAPQEGSKSADTGKTDQANADKAAQSALDKALPGVSSNDPLMPKSPAPTPQQPQQPQQHTVATPSPPPNATTPPTDQPKVDPLAPPAGLKLPPSPAGAPPKASPSPAPSTTVTQPPAPSTPTDMKTSPDGRVAAALAAPPPDPLAAQTQNAKDQVANTSQAKTSTPNPPPPAAAPNVPQVLTAAGGDDSVPAAATTPAPKPADKNAVPNQTPQQQSDPNAQLAAALPMSQFGMPSTFRSILTSQGTSTRDDYKGAVYGAFNRSPEAGRIMQDAERQHLKGVVVVGLTVGDSGGIDSLSVIQSSGQVVVDNMALELVRSSAPFPRPPPGSPRSFTPAIVIGNP